MKVVSKLTLNNLYSLRKEWKYPLDVQAQFIKEGLQVIIKKTGKDLLLPYNNVFENHNHYSDIKDDKYCFVYYTKVESNASKASKFTKRDFVKRGSRYIIEGYPFEKNQVSFLNEKLLAKYNLYEFVLSYMDEFISYKVKDFEKNQVSILTESISLRHPSRELANIIINKEKKENKMSKITKIAEDTVQVNKEAMVLAAKLEVGKVATAQLKKVVIPKLPYMARGYADSPLFDIALANVVGIALREYALGNEKAQIVSEAMIQSAAVEMMSSFDLNGMIDDMLENVDVSKLVKLDNKTENNK